MKRRDFIKKASATGLVAGSVSAPSIVSAKSALRWKMVTTWPKNFPGLGTGANYLAKTIKELSDGRLLIKVYGAGELVPALGIFDAVKRGMLDIDELEIVGELKITNFRRPPLNKTNLWHFRNLAVSVVKNKAKFILNGDSCIKCGRCADICPRKAIEMKGFPEWGIEKCIHCYCCQEVCPEEAITFEGGVKWWAKPFVAAAKKIVDKKRQGS